MRVLAILVLGLVVAVTAIRPRHHRIVGGTETTIEQYPQMAGMLYNFGGGIFELDCGGAIINNRAILTAAHCLADEPTQSIRFRLGSTYANSGGVVYSVARIIIHPNYGMHNYLDFDIAIAHTAAFIEFSNVIKAAPIAGANYNIADNQLVWAAGWGVTTNPEIDPEADMSEVLRHVELKTINQNICTERYAAHPLGQFSVTENMLCVGWLDVGGRDQCFGDSGSPLFHNSVVVGVSSWGPPGSCGDAFYPGVNVRVSAMSQWIVSNA